MMQGKQAVSNLERKGPHKSMHCKFCKRPGVDTPEKTTRAQLETKTKIHLAHEAADLRLCNTQDEPGFPSIESEACMCVLEGENPCPKCVPDKNRKPAKKKTCRCPKGAKPHPNMLVKTTPPKKKQESEDDEFWWEKYSREHDAAAQETWAAYLAQRRKDKLYAKYQKHKQEQTLKKDAKSSPPWFQKLSCQQMIFLEFLSTAIRLDSDENITDRTLYVLGGIGLYPRPRKKIIKKCLRYCHYNSIKFLDQLRLLTLDDDPFFERGTQAMAQSFTWNDRLIMNSICHLEFPMLLREIMDRLPAFPREQILPQIPYPVFPKIPLKKYDNPYEEPIWRDRLNWVEKMKIDRLNRSRAHMDTKRVKIPPLALVRRPSLIDARPPFLAQIEANEQSSRRFVQEKEKKVGRKRPVLTFNSEVDVTAIAGIAPSEISTTDKADTDEICVFLQEQFKGVTEGEEEERGAEGEGEEEEMLSGREVKCLEPETTEINQLKSYSDFEEYDGEDMNMMDIPFKTPPKTESGNTIIQPCPPPQPSPGPPAPHYEYGKRELQAINKESCGFQPFISSSAHTTNVVNEDQDEVTQQLTSAAEKLLQFADEEFDTKDDEKVQKEKCPKKQSKYKKIKKNKEKFKKKEISKKVTNKKVINKKVQGSKPNSSPQNITENELQNDDFEENDDDDVIGDIDMFLETRIERKEVKVAKKESFISDPDPESEDEWFRREPCLTKSTELDEADKSLSKKQRVKKKKLKRKKKGKKNRRKGGKKEVHSSGKEESQKYSKNKKDVERDGKETMTGNNSGQGSRIKSESNTLTEKKTTIEQREKGEEDGDVRKTFSGDVTPLLTDILKDLADEGYLSAAFDMVSLHPDITQLIQYLKGEIVKKETRERLHLVTKARWAKMKSIGKFEIPDIGISSKKLGEATWNDKRWISQKAIAKKDEFYFKVAKNRADFGRDIYNTLYQHYFGTGRYLKIFYAYMTAKYEDAILRGIF